MLREAKNNVTDYFVILIEIRQIRWYDKKEK